jgi:glycosyltransferase involved in cell wall biosynthesis
MRLKQLSKTVLFHRNFKRFSGGHLKVWHYYTHLQESNGFKPLIYFSERSVWNDDNPWLSLKGQTERTWNPQSADILFLAGKDWLALEGAVPLSRQIPIVNLIQHVRHADPADIRFSFLSKRAVRICVSEPVAQSLRDTAMVNGPIFTVSNGIALDELPVAEEWDQRPIDVLIAGLKNSVLAAQLAERLRGANFAPEVLLARLPRRLFLEKLNQSKIVILLPNETEGFYLPALEAMALHALVVCPDCRGNRSFCADGFNCLMPKYTLSDMVQTTSKAISIEASERQKLLSAARQTVLRHSLLNEKNEFLAIMQELGNIW